MPPARTAVRGRPTRRPAERTGTSSTSGVCSRLTWGRSVQTSQIFPWERWRPRRPAVYRRYTDAGETPALPGSSPRRFEVGDLTRRGRFAVPRTLPATAPRAEVDRPEFLSVQGAARRVRILRSP